MANFYTDNADLQFYMNKGVDWPPLIKAAEFPNTDFDNSEMLESYKQVMELLGAFSGDQIAPFTR